MNNITINDKLSLIEYMATINNISKEFFDDNGDYTPQFGKLNAMRLFYNICVKDDIANLPHNISDAFQMEELVKDKRFISEFDIAIKNKYSSELTFSNAYNTAIDIVKNKRNSANRIVDMLQKMLSNLLGDIIDSLSEENLNKIEKIAKDISDGKISNDTIMQALENSDYRKKLLEDTQSEK